MGKKPFKLNLVSAVIPPYWSAIFEIKDKNSPNEVVAHALDLIHRYPDKLIAYVKTEPKLIEEDSVIRLSIQLLADYYANETQVLASKAGEILKKIGLLGLSKGGQKRKTKFYYIQQWQSEPSSLLVMVGKMRLKLIKNLNEYKDKSSAYQKTYYECFGEQVSRKTLEQLFLGEHDSDQWRVTLGFIAHRFEVPYEMLRKVYYRARKQMTLANARSLQEKLHQWWDNKEVQLMWCNLDEFSNIPSLKLPSKKS